MYIAFFWHEVPFSPAQHSFLLNALVDSSGEACFPLSQHSFLLHTFVYSSGKEYFPCNIKLLSNFTPKKQVKLLKIDQLENKKRLSF